ncbi:type I restriction-modification system endonuclease [Comamonas testosteroni]|uniref:Type-1 restriction enzyme R protein n=1 Tax=Comamonas testosteroni TaxID=285 RepID=A0A8B4S6C5_COMTE|nr:type I restriction-modification system endonuclease [Comamonas testosteroni]QQN68290.1 type I restriction-modification system endonuclease [Comamonas testosteroni]SUY78456.1 Type-1 restriction enzyme R protein [Comamonas testosteroni]
MSNFAFLGAYSKSLAALGLAAEKIFPHDPPSCVAKLRLLAEAIAKEVAGRIGLQPQLQPSTQSDLIRSIDSKLGLDPQLRQMFHLLRMRGNEAVHEVGAAIGYREALESLKVAREVALWFHRTFGSNADYKAGPFLLPDDPSQKLYDLQKQMEALHERLSSAQALSSDQEAMQQLLQQQADQEKALAAKALQERDIYEQLAMEASATIEQLKAELAKSDAVEKAPSPETVRSWSSRSRKAASLVQMDEPATRLIIDQMLRDAGWSADTVAQTYAKGARPARGQNMAIAEWPMKGQQSADYVLFAGLTPVAVVEAKRLNQNVAGKIGQAERYARSFLLSVDCEAAWKHEQPPQPWQDGQGALFQIPFAYSCNGRPFVRQHEQSSGTWFRDLRHTANLARPLPSFHSPEGLLDVLRRDIAKAQGKLETETAAYLGLRSYQLNAISAVEQCLAQGQRSSLLAMATGTGKTRTIIGLIYRFLKAERFKRILFLVDRTALGDQALEAFDDMLLEQNMPLSKLYNIADLGDMATEAEDRVQVATVQAMVKRIFDSDSPPPVDRFDCVIVDEAHRGYTLDQEMTEGEQELRDASQYLSTYRRVLDYFDAFKVGLTATPAKHTSDIFGHPIYTYSYREAVADDWLIDHEPPIRYTTLLTQNGIHFEKGDAVESIHLQTGEIDTAELEDELHFDVASFNKTVLNDNFNRVICNQLAQELDPFSDEKTMIFCATDTHADTVVRMLGEAFKELHGDAYNQATVAKITGKTDKVSQMIRNYKNEAYPKVAVTVDLLTTGIDVPRICNLVFMRRVRSRILYEQMIGRATRRCDDIGKTVFRIYDPVDLYATLQGVNTMQPLVKDPKVTIDQLIDELHNPASYTAPGSTAERKHADDVLDQLNQKLMRVLRKATHKAEKKPALKERLQQLEQSWGVPPAQLHKHLHDMAKKQGTQAVAHFLRNHTRLLQQLGEVQELMGTAYRPVLSDHHDELVAREQNWGSYSMPEDYLEGFAHFIKEQLNQSVALSVVVNRPKDLTRELLREVRLLLDGAGFSEAALKAAWRNQSNQDIAAGIVAHIRKAALGEALLPFEDRVNRAMQRIYSLRSWTTAQRSWLDRIAKQLKHETVVDSNFLNEAFRQQGGTKQVDKVLGGELDTVVTQLAEALWQKVA